MKTATFAYLRKIENISKPDMGFASDAVVSDKTFYVLRQNYERGKTEQFGQRALWTQAFSYRGQVFII